MPNTAGIKVLRVAARANGYRREGLRFNLAAADVPEAILTSGQIHRLKRDAMLECKEVTVYEQPAVSDEELTALREKAAITDAFLAKLPPGYSWEQCPTEYITHLQDQVHELELAKATASDASASATSTKVHGKK